MIPKRVNKNYRTSPLTKGLVPTGNIDFSIELNREEKCEYCEVVFHPMLEDHTVTECRDRLISMLREIERRAGYRCRTLDNG
jgi:hypothetical protein